VGGWVNAGRCCVGSRGMYSHRCIMPDIMLTGGSRQWNMCLMTVILAI
jgi:hypothetical protein